MICTKCGISVADNSTVCPNCGQVFVYAQQPQQQPTQYQTTQEVNNTNKPEFKSTKTIIMLIWGALSTVSCGCFPGGGIVSLILSIIALVNGNAVNNLWAQGQYDLAQKKADSAKKLTNLALIANIVIGVICIILIIILCIALEMGVFANLQDLEYTNTYTY